MTITDKYKTEFVFKNWPNWNELHPKSITRFSKLKCVRKWISKRRIHVPLGSNGVKYAYMHMPLWKIEGL